MLIFQNKSNKKKIKDVTLKQRLGQSAAWEVTSLDGDLSVLITLGDSNGLSSRRIFGPVI